MVQAVVGVALQEAYVALVKVVDCCIYDAVLLVQHVLAVAVTVSAGVVVVIITQRSSLVKWEQQEPRPRTKCPKETPRLYCSHMPLSKLCKS